MNPNIRPGTPIKTHDGHWGVVMTVPYSSTEVGVQLGCKSVGVLEYYECGEFLIAEDGDTACSHGGTLFDDVLDETDAPSKTEWEAMSVRERRAYERGRSLEARKWTAIVEDLRWQAEVHRRVYVVAAEAVALFEAAEDTYMYSLPLRAGLRDLRDAVAEARRTGCA